MRDEIKLYLFLGSWMALVIFIGGGYILYDSYAPESIQQDEDMGLEVIAEEEYSQDEEINVILSSAEGPVEGAQAELNGEEIGITDENGEIRFTSETGANTVQFNYEGQELSETVEVISDEDESADGSSEEDQEQDGQEPESETESESETGEELEIEITYDPENPSANDQVTFEASTNAEAETYEWSSFDTQLQEEQGQTDTEQIR